MILPGNPRKELVKEKKIAILLAILFMSILIYVSLLIGNSLNENVEIEQARVFHLPFDFSFYNNSLPPDLQMDLEVHFPHGILVEGDPIFISGVAVANTQIAQNVVDVAINFQNAQAYPVSQDERGITKGISLNMLRSQDNSTLAGNVTLVWNIPGTYYPRIWITRLQGNGRLMIHPSETRDVAIIVYPKSQLAQIKTNKATLLLAFAAYLLAFVGAFNIIYSLWTKNSSSKN